MVLDEQQSALKRNRDILLATIDYISDQRTGRILFDGNDPMVQFYNKLSQKAERDYKKGSIKQIQKALTKLIKEEIYPSGDLYFSNYIKDKTGYEIDVFENLSQRVTDIFARNGIANEKEYQDLLVMRHVLQQPGSDKKMLATLDKLRLAYEEKKDNQNEPSAGNQFFRKMLSEAYSPNRKRKLTVVEIWNDDYYQITDVSLSAENGGAGLYTANGRNLKVEAYWKDDNSVIIETKKDYEVVSSKHNKIQIVDNVFQIEIIED